MDYITVEYFSNFLMKFTIVEILEICFIISLVGWNIMLTSAVRKLHSFLKDDMEQEEIMNGKN